MATNGVQKTVIEVALRLTGKQHKVLREHLFPGDGKEAAAIVVAGRRAVLSGMCCVPAR